MGSLGYGLCIRPWVVILNKLPVPLYLQATLKQLINNGKDLRYYWQEASRGQPRFSRQQQDEALVLSQSADKALFPR